MSRPTTAVATLANHHHHSHDGPRQDHHQITSLCPTASSLLQPPYSSVPAPSSSPATPRCFSTENPPAGYHPTLGQTLQNHQPANSSAPKSCRIDHNYLPLMASATATAALGPRHNGLGGSSSRKRRRSREPDWESFYRNGLPKEVIVIDDTPEPAPSRAIGKPTSSLTNGESSSGAAFETSVGRRPVKRPRQAQHAVSHPDSPLQQDDSTLSSDRTNSFAKSTAPTSLSSNSQHDGASTSSKRKRTTRQQTASEAKRRNVDGLGRPFSTYRPPPFPPHKVSDIHPRVVFDQQQQQGKNVNVDDDDGHYIVVPDAKLTERYQIIRLLGQGTFGKVVEAHDRKRNEAVAIKIIRSIQKYRDASKIELRVLATLKANDVENKNQCIHLTECFDYQGHICIVMDLLGQSIFDFLKGNNFVPFPNSQIQRFAHQLFTSVAYLHDLNLIHTDLKPENILLCDASYQTFTYDRRVPSSSTAQSRHVPHRRVLLDTETRLIDFGSATFQDEYHSSVVSTRHYRAPEIILGLGWSYPCDIWSIGCILIELFTGDALFQTHDNLEHLAMMEAVVGSKIDNYLVQAVNKSSTRNGGNPASKYFKRLKLDYPAPDTSRGSRKFVKAMKCLDDIIPSSNRFFNLFLDLLRNIFLFDPAKRVTAQQALNHPWFKEIAQPDDGTEAAKIRQGRRPSEKGKARHQQYL